MEHTLQYYCVWYVAGGKSVAFFEMQRNVNVISHYHLPIVDDFCCSSLSSLWCCPHVHITNNNSNKLFAVVYSLALAAVLIKDGLTPATSLRLWSGR